MLKNTSPANPLIAFSASYESHHSRKLVLVLWQQNSSANLLTVPLLIPSLLLFVNYSRQNLLK